MKSLREEVRQARGETAAPPAQASTQKTPTASEAKTFSFSPSTRATQETKLDKLGLGPLKEQIRDQLGQERKTVLQRFESLLAPGQWEDYRKAQSLGWHRQAPEDHAKMANVNKLFRQAQEEALKANAGAWAGLTDRQREGIEPMRGGRLTVDPDGKPSVKEIPQHSEDGMVFYGESFIAE